VAQTVVDASDNSVHDFVVRLGDRKHECFTRGCRERTINSGMVTVAPNLVGHVLYKAWTVKSAGMNDQIEPPTIRETGNPRNLIVRGEQDCARERETVKNWDHDAVSITIWRR